MLSPCRLGLPLLFKEAVLRFGPLVGNIGAEEMQPDSNQASRSTSLQGTQEREE